MKKFTKIALISALVCLVLGLGVFIGGLALGGTWQGLKESIDHGDYSIGGSDGTYGIYMTEKSEDSSSSNQESSVPQEKTSNAAVYSNVQKIEIDMQSGGLYFEPTNDKELRVSVNGKDGKETTVRQNGDELEIYNDFRNHKGNVRIYYPEDMNFREISISMGGGDVAVKGSIKADEFDAELGAGVFHAEEIEATESSWEVGAGEIVLGRIESRDMDFDCGTGSIEAKIAGNQQDFNYDLECGIGSVKIGNEEYGGVAFDKTINNGQNRQIEISCGIGEIQLSFEQ